MSTKGSPVFTFTLPAGAARPLSPLSVTPPSPLFLSRQPSKMSQIMRYVPVPGISLNGTVGLVAEAWASEGFFPGGGQ